MRYLLTLLLLLPFSLQAQQSTGVIQGRITTPGDTAVELVNVSLISLPDSALYSNTTTNEKGAFAFSGIKPGAYFLRMSHLSFNAKEMPLQVKTTPDTIRLHAIKLDHRTNTLSEATKQAKRPLFVKEGGKLIFNIENSVVNSLQSDLVALIQSLPGVWIDQQGNILLNGQEKVLVTINNKSTPLTRNDLLQLLKGIPVNNVKSVEINTNPTAKQDATGSAVINIKTKDKVDMGFNGSVSTAFGSSVGYGGLYPKLNPALSLSLGKKNFSAYANYNYNYKKTWGSVTEKLSFLETNSTLQQAVRFESKPEQSHTVAAGINGQLSSNQSLNVYYSGNTNSKIIDQTNAILLSSETAPPTNITSSDDEDFDSDQHMVGLSYKNDIDSTKSLSLGADYITMNKDNVAEYNNTFLKQNTPSQFETIRNNTATNIKAFAGQADYTQQLSAKTELEAGFKYSHVKTKNSVDLQRLENQEFVKDSMLSNAFSYRENLIAGYVNLNTKIKDWRITAGLRYENSDMSGTSPTNAFTFSRTIAGFFPNVSVNHPVSKDLELGLSYARRISRPNYVDVNPFVYYVNPYVSLAGNPSLIPSFTNKVQLSAQFKQMYSATLTYFHTSDYFTQSQFQNVETQAQRLVTANIGDMSNIDLNLGIPASFTPWWESYFDIGFAYQEFRENTTVGLGFSSTERFTFQLFSQHDFSLPKDYKIEFSNLLVTPSVQGQFKFSTIYNFSTGIKKSLLNKKLELKLALSDIFRTQKYIGALGAYNWRSNFQNVSDSRQLLLSVKYNFYNKGKVKVKQANWISNDEKNRMK